MKISIQHTFPKKNVAMDDIYIYIYIIQYTNKVENKFYILYDNIDVHF